MTTKPPKRIDMSTGIFDANGTTYFIQPLEMHYERLVPFNRMKPKIMEGISHEEAVTWIFHRWNDLRNPDPDKSLPALWGDLRVAFDKFCNDLQGRKPSDISKVNLDMYMEFCTYFITVQGEDLSKYDKTLAYKKIEDWKEEIYPPDFFLIAWQRLQSLTEEYNNFVDTFLGK